MIICQPSGTVIVNCGKIATEVIIGADKHMVCRLQLAALTERAVGHAHSVEMGTEAAMTSADSV